MGERTSSGVLIGRDAERRWLLARLHAAAEGRGSAAVVLGDPGMGKTALVESVLPAETPFRIIRVIGVEAEAAQPFGALQRVLFAHPGPLGELPAAQRDALRAATGLVEGPAPARSVVGLGLLSLLSSLSEESPVVCFLDDAHWVDAESLQAFAFVGRRLLAERLALIFALRTQTTTIDLLDDFATCALEGLDAQDALSLLDSSTRSPLDARVAERIVIATAGNPLALVDLSHELTERQLNGSSALPEPIPLGQHLEAHYLRRVRALPPATQRWLLTAAADPESAAAAVAAASDAQGLPADASRAAELADLVRVDSTIRFRHPLIRSAVYNGAPSHDVRAAHEALGHVADRQGEPDLAVIHRAASAMGPDAAVADELESAADRAVRRGGLSTRARLLARAADLSTTEDARTRRILAAVESAIAAGSAVQASTLIAGLAGKELRAEDRGRLAITRSDLSILNPMAGATFARRAHDLVSAARLLRESDPARAKRTLAYAFWALIQADHLAEGVTSSEIAGHALDLCRLVPSDDPIDLGLRALSTFLLDGPEPSTPLAERAIARCLDPAVSDEAVLEAYACTAYAAQLLHLFDAGQAVLRRAEVIARSRGAVWVLCRVLLLSSYFDAQHGRVEEGSRHLTDAADLMSFMGTSGVYAEIVTMMPTIRGWAGEAVIHDELVGEARRVGYGLSVTAHVLGGMLVEMANGRYAEAWRMGRGIDVTDPLFHGHLYLTDLIECAARAGDADAARALLARLGDGSRAQDDPWLAGALARADALIDDEAAGARFETALRLFAVASAPMDRARTHLLYGEWLRRRRQRSRARDHLLAAHAAFAEGQATGWRDRAARELEALGQTAPAADPKRAALTSRELSIATLASEGATNSDIAAELFISPSTVDYHLRKVFRKLGATSRRQLGHALRG